eukprot:CAMPEP_0178417072 /NCGR_PEP_ID=MMETSP0689_2-20121128/24389_1 /TAXON_ID=160604 /ORGANISM="Amphidinium massartii, Strain CS-259" /LENGTH=311 /DNA_ID=CAMNT_0020038433 /DNA_START=59 /DNA_END=989 /DNA_ORIENTATION=-
MMADDSFDSLDEGESMSHKIAMVTVLCPTEHAAAAPPQQQPEVYEDSMCMAGVFSEESTEQVEPDHENFMMRQRGLTRTRLLELGLGLDSSLAEEGLLFATADEAEEQEAPMIPQVALTRSEVTILTALAAVTAAALCKTKQEEEEDEEEAPMTALMSLSSILEGAERKVLMAATATQSADTTKARPRRASAVVACEEAGRLVRRSESWHPLATASPYAAERKEHKQSSLLQALNLQTAAAALSLPAKEEHLCGGVALWRALRATGAEENEFANGCEASKRPAAQPSDQSKIEGSLGNCTTSSRANDDDGA